MVDKKIFGERIRARRSEIGLTQSELAEKLNVSFQAVSGWECGNTLPDLDNLCELSVIFGAPIDELLKERESADVPTFIGVDGGGSSTEFLLFTADGHVLFCVKLAGTNATTIGLSAALLIFYRGIDACLAKQTKIQGIFMGCAGGLLDEVVKNLSEKYRDIPICVDSDGVNALRSADGDAAMILGTGSVFLRREPDGSYRKFGGWGHAWGDFGSAFNLGREAIIASLAYEDGVETSPLICALTKEKINAQSMRAYARSKPEVSLVAKHASVIFDAYRQNDPYAEQILRGEMKRLAATVRSVCPKGGRILACGGINEHYGDLILPILREYVPENIEFVLPSLPPIYGACREALRRFGVAQGKKFFENFSADYKRLTQ